MKYLPILHMLLGVLIAIASWLLAGLKARVPEVHVPSGDGIILDYIPPNAIIEFVLVFFSIAVLTCGFFQWKARIKYAGLQLIFGGVTSGISIFLAIRAATLGHGERSALYYIVYGVLALGISVLITGLLQTIKQFVPDKR